MARPRKNPAQRLRKTHVKRDDVVVVLTGIDKGKSGRVLSVDRKKARVLVEGINVRQQTMRRTPSNPQGGLAEKECPIHISNVMPEDKYRERRKKADETTPTAAGAKTETQEKGEN
ncbi:MAG: 50S ribosomal protein L24 [Kiritimatiellaeota bacterium]|nr:50S ribosomal protein L24 [Kiritimatiellota bacterium]